jgi:peptidase E
MRQIIALGGGGFLMEPENPLLDQYILTQSHKPNPKICFLPTASGDSEDFIERFYRSFEKMNCIPSHLSLFNPPTRKIKDYILSKDIIYVGGGNTKNLLAIWKDWGLDLILKEAWEHGIVLSGISAGSLCWFEEGITDSFGNGLDSIKCLGFLKGSNCPHYDGEIDRRPTYHKLISSGRLQSGFAVDDGVGLHFIDLDINKIVSSRPSAKAYKVEYLSNQVIEEVLHVEFLGD